MTRRELASDIGLMIKLGHALNGTIQEEIRTNDDVYAYQRAVSFISYDSSQNLTVRQVISVAEFLNSISFSADSKVNDV